ncbi:hypothetical protein HDV01_004970 [Terramyces sp. JEL0728]|nr:hypothetical protein HDV01_004970 [Terramyces sp. JEL0728]
MIQSPSEQLGLNLENFTTIPNIEYKLMDELLALKTPILSPEIVEYLQGKDAVKDFMNRITLYRDHNFMYNKGSNDTIGLGDDTESYRLEDLEIQTKERDRNDNLKEAFVAMDLITRPKNTLKKIYTKDLVDELFFVLKPESKGSLFHFRKIFMTALLYHPNLLYSLEEFIFLMINQIINQPVQDTITCCFTAIYTKNYLPNKDDIYMILRDIKLLDYLFTKMVCDDIGLVRAFCSTITRILNILDLQESLVLLKEYELPSGQDDRVGEHDQPKKAVESTPTEIETSANMKETKEHTDKQIPKVNSKQAIFDEVIKMLEKQDVEIKKEIIDFISNINFTGHCQPIKAQIINSLHSQIEIITSLELLKQNCSIYQSKLYKLVKKSHHLMGDVYPSLVLSDGLFSTMIVELFEKNVPNEEYERVNKIGKGKELVVEV